MAEGNIVKPTEALEGLADELECSICNEHFKRPKYLNCVHTFCEQCLMDLAKSMKGRKKLPCPLCREETPIPAEGISKGLKTNTMALSIVDKLSSLTVGVSMATNGGGDHSGDEDKCRDYQDQVLNYYCRTCRQLVCRECCIVDHCRPDHDVCKVQDVTVEKKKALQKILKDVRSKLQQCRVQNECTVEVKTTLESSLEKARSELNKRAEAMMTRIASRCEAANDAFEKVEQTRNVMIKKTEDEHQARKIRLEEMLREVEYLLYGSDATLAGKANSMINGYKTALKEMEKKLEVLDPSLGFVEFGLAPASTAAANAEVGEVYEDTKWVMYARTKDKLELTQARGVDMFENGTIVIADNSGEYPGFVYVIDSVDVESCLLVDENGRFLDSNKDFDTFADVKSVEMDGSPRDVIAVPVIHTDAKCSGCMKSPLIGTKYTCVECDDFHLCSECINWNGHKRHAFTINKYPFLYAPVLGVVGDDCEIGLYRADHGGRSVFKMAFSNNNRPWADWLPKSDGQQTQLWSVARDPSLGQIFVTEASTNMVYQFALKGNSRGAELQQIATIPVELKPWFLSVNRHRRQIASSNWKSCRVDVVNYWGQFLYSITHKGDGKRLRPNGVCFDGRHTLYVVHRDTKPNHGEVHRYNAADGSHVGVAVTGLFKPYGISIENGKMVVADLNEVKIFKRKQVIGVPKIADADDPAGVIIIAQPVPDQEMRARHNMGAFFN